MRNKNLYQEKITRLESTLTVIGRGISSNDRQQAFEALERAKNILADMQTMLNREQESYN